MEKFSFKVLTLWRWAWDRDDPHPLLLTRDSPPELTHAYPAGTMEIGIHWQLCPPHAGLTVSLSYLYLPHGQGVEMDKGQQGNNNKVLKCTYGL